MAAAPTAATFAACPAAPIGHKTVRRTSLHRKRSQLGFARAADRDAAAVAAADDDILAVAPPETWLIPALLTPASTQADASQHDSTACPVSSAARPTPDLEGSAAFAAAVDAAAAKLSLSLDLELSPEETQWLVQAAALPESPAPVPSPAPAPEQPAVAATTRRASQQTAAVPAAATHPAISLLAALRRSVCRRAGGLRSRLAAAACTARPATLEC